MLVAIASVIFAAQGDLLGRFAAAEYGAKTLTASEAIKGARFHGLQSGSA